MVYNMMIEDKNLRWSDLHGGRNRGILSVTSDAKALIAKIDKIIEKIDVNGLRIKVVKIWPLTLDIRIKEK